MNFNRCLMNVIRAIIGLVKKVKKKLPLSNVVVKIGHVSDLLWFLPVCLCTKWQLSVVYKNPTGNI
jgi:hypothetical protein